jgi:hypothetical protein
VPGPYPGPRLALLRRITTFCFKVRCISTFFKHFLNFKTHDIGGIWWDMVGYGGIWWDLVVGSFDSTRSRKLVGSVVESFDSTNFPKSSPVAF